jgi:sulfoxide reductase heme-binding subunit YedZ
MPTLKNIWDHPYTFWTLLSIPAIPMLIGLSSGDPKTIHQLLHPSGEFAARFMIITMMITPLVMWLKGWRGPRWLMKRRRYLGVATFGYALLHTLFYLLDLGTLALSGNEISKLYIWTGWLAFFIFVPLAITSSDAWVRSLGPRWKSLQRWVYGAAVLTLFHWAALHDWGGIGSALVHFMPLILLESYRVWSNLSRKAKRAAA